MDRKQLKAQSKNLIRTAQPKPVVPAIIYLLIVAVLGFLSYKLVGGSTFELQSIYEQFGIDGAYGSIDPDQFAYAIEQAMPSPGAALLNLALSIVALMIGAGFTIYCLRTVRGMEASYWNLFDAFGMFFRVIWLYILEGIFIFLWSLLFIIPGFIAFYRYRQALYLLLEHPEMSALQCTSALWSVTRASCSGWTLPSSAGRCLSALPIRSASGLPEQWARRSSHRSSALSASVFWCSSSCCRTWI